MVGFREHPEPGGHGAVRVHILQCHPTLSFERTLEECPGQRRPCATVSLSYPDITRAGSAAVVDSLNRGILRPLLQSIDIEGASAYDTVRHVQVGENP